MRRKEGRLEGENRKQPCTTWSCNMLAFSYEKLLASCCSSSLFVFKANLNQDASTNEPETRERNGKVHPDTRSQHSNDLDRGQGQGHLDPSDLEDPRRLSSHSSFHEVDRGQLVEAGFAELRSQRPKQALPRFPKKPDSMVNAEEMEKRREQFQDYLTNLMASEFFRNHPETVSWKIHLAKFFFWNVRLPWERALFAENPGMLFA